MTFATRGGRQVAKCAKCSNAATNATEDIGDDDSTYDEDMETDNDSDDPDYSP